MATDFVEKAKEDIHDFLTQNNDSVKFTVKFNGEFFIAIANKKLTEKIISCNLSSVSGFTVSSNKIVFNISNEWVKQVISDIDDAECLSDDLMIYSQAKRLKKQIEFGLSGGVWDDEMYSLAKKILYFLHTKSKSIRLNVVKLCAREYNKTQRQGKIPDNLTLGYMNALCQISHKL